MCVIIHQTSSIISDQFTNPIRSLRFRHDVASSIAWWQHQQLTPYYQFRNTLGTFSVVHIVKLIQVLTILFRPTAFLKLCFFLQTEKYGFYHKLISNEKSLHRLKYIVNISLKLSLDHSILFHFHQSQTNKKRGHFVHKGRTVCGFLGLLCFFTRCGVVFWLIHNSSI